MINHSPPMAKQSLQKKKNLPWGWSNARTGCPETSQSLHPRRCSKPDWTWSWASWWSWLCFEQGALLEDLQRHLPTSAILSTVTTAAVNTRVVHQNLRACTASGGGGVGWGWGLCVHITMVGREDCKVLDLVKERCLEVCRCLLTFSV